MYHLTEDELKKAAEKLAPAPQVFGKIGSMLRDRRSCLQDITRLVNNDSSLTAQVLRISNSVAFSGGDPVRTLEEAIHRIGFKELFRVLGIAASATALTAKNVVYNTDGKLLWQNTLITGMSMEFLAKLTGEDEAEAYTLGLLKTIGRQAIDAIASSYRIPPRYFPKYGALIEWEKSAFDTTNALAASCVLRAWNFSEISHQTLEHQYAPDGAPHKNKFCRLLYISNAVAEKLGKALPGEEGCWDNYSDFLEELELSDHDFQKACDYASERVGEVVGSVAC